MPPLDATYFSEAALRAFQRRQRKQELDTEGSYDRTDLGESIRRLAEQRGETLQGTKETAAGQGLFYSGQLGKRLGQVETDFTRRQGDMQRDFDRREAGREAARAAIDSGAPLEEAAAAAAATDRQIQRDTEAADAGTLARNPAPKPAAAKKPAPRRPAPARPKPRPQRRPRGNRQTYRPGRARQVRAGVRPAGPRR